MSTEYKKTDKRLLAINKGLWWAFYHNKNAFTDKEQIEIMRERDLILKELRKRKLV